MIGMALSAVLFIMSWATLALPFRECLYALAGVFVLLVAAEVWRERTIDPLSGYFTLRATLTIGVLATIAWRVMLGI